MANRRTATSPASRRCTAPPAGTHNPANLGTGAIDALLVEFKTAAPGKAALPTSREGMTVKVLAESPRATAYRSTASATFAEPAGSKHDFDQVVIALGPASMSLSIDGKPAKTTWARGDVQFIGRGVAHRDQEHRWQTVGGNGGSWRSSKSLRGEAGDPSFRLAPNCNECRVRR